MGSPVPHKEWIARKARSINAGFAKKPHAKSTQVRFVQENPTSFHS